ncbi:hypothetical protein [Aeromicrobium sp. UC242_57]|uniref:hypothetical protein n=1 Tax=Aeromicrobium sp. UC242_57 TaxID=3374624 RepID=UPI0037C152A5
MVNRITGVDVNAIVDVRRRVSTQVVGRSHELELLLAAVGAGRDLVIEGPPGTSKTTLLGAITREWGVPLVFVEGNADLTPSKLWGTTILLRYCRTDTRPRTSLTARC